MNPNQIALPNIAGGTSTTGQMELGQIEELQKALTAGYGTDSAQFTGATALRIQSLDKTMKATIQENKHFRLFNALVKNGATATVDEWTEQSSVGGFLGGSTNTETGTIASAQGAYARRVGLVKYLMTKREVSFVATLGNNIAAIESVEQSNGAKQLLTDAEFLCFEGDDTVVSTEFPGVYAQITAGVTAGQVDAENVYDLDGGALNNVDPISAVAAQIAAYGNFGTPTHVFTSQNVQSDFDTNLDPAFRVPLTDVPGGGIQIGSPVRGIRTSWGDIATMPDVFVRDEKMMQPFEVLYPTIATAQGGLTPASVTVDASNADAASRFTAARAGNYYWLVAGLDANGQSTGTVTAQTLVAAGKKAVLTITKSAGGAEVAYAVYRSRLNGTNAPADMRLMGRIAKAGNTTTYTDLNRELPGTTKAFVLNLTPGDDAINWRQLLPMLKFPLYPTASAVIPWAQLMFGYLRITKRKHHAIIKNIVPSKASWKPFG